MREPIAIVGIGAVFPGAADAGAFWSNIERGVDAITDVPASRIEPVYLAQFTARRGGFIAPSFDPVAFGIMPVAASSAEPDQLLALAVASAALDDAGYRERQLPRERTGVILGRGGYMTPGMARLSNRVRVAQQITTTLAELVPDLDAATLEKIRAAFVAKSGEVGTDSAIGLVPNLAASRVANRLDLRGPAYTIDAACASSLLAVDQACRELGDQRCDVVLAGGVHVCHDVTFWSVFTQLGALSKASAIRPFDRRADGILIGEGAGFVVLKRLADAERDGDRIYAVIHGTGVSSDGRESSAMRPRADGQLAALAGAWGGLDRGAIGLVEAHGTGTPTGDEVELSALGTFFGEVSGARAGLGSVKSMIGHAMPAAGIAGLIKAALAVHHRVLPPSLHCDDPHPQLAATRFRVLAKAEPWDATSRTAGVSAFGFGGINAHIVLANVPDRGPRAAARAATPAHDAGPRAPVVLAVAGNTVDELRAALAEAAAHDAGATAATHAAAASARAAAAMTAGPTGAMRLALLDPTPARLALANKALDRGKPLRGTQDIWFAPSGLAAGGKLAFVFPGIEGGFAPQIADVAAALGVALPAAIPTGIAATGSSSRELELRGAGVFALGRFLVTALARTGIAPDAIAGHSLGEWTGMVASEMIPPAHVDTFVADLPAGSLEVPDVIFAAVGCGAAGAEQALDGLDAIAVSHDNCPHQSILCGRADPVRIAIERLGQRGVLCQELPFKSGFHSPLLADYLGVHRAHLAKLVLQRPAIPLWSATICRPYPDDFAGVRALTIDHLVKPVRFRELIDNMYAAGFRTFLQLGVGSVGGFIDDTLRGRDHLAIAAASATHSGLHQLARVTAALYAEGYLASAELTLAERAAPQAPRSLMALELGVPLIKLGTAVPPIRAAAPVRDRVDDPVLAEMLATLDDAADATRAVLDAYRTKQRPRTAVVRRKLSVEAVPALIDHCFYRQPEGWPHVTDRYPVVPMTMNLQLMADAAVTLDPTRVAIALEDVRAYRWLAVAPAVEVAITARRRDADRIDVDIPGYARATVRLAERFPDAPAPQLGPLANPRAAPHAADRMYVDRWMFHGPQYAGVVDLGPIGDDGVDGAIEVLPAPGALLDNAGQLMGWWVMQTEDHDRLAMPVRIDRVALFGPEPPVGAHVQCRVRMRGVAEREVRADLELVAAGKIWARIDGWEDRRFDSDDIVWAVLREPEWNVLATAHGPYVAVTPHWRAAASQELMMRRYLDERERAQFEAIGPRGKKGWLLGRMAIKDAVRMHAWRAGKRPIYPVEIAVDNAASGRPIVTSPYGAVHVSVAHKDDIAVAIVSAAGAVGIDIERIEPRTPAFLATAFTEAERALATDDAAITRLWAAKEAVAKRRGTGITDPKLLRVREHGDRSRLRFVIDDDVVETTRDGDYVIAWSQP